MVLRNTDGQIYLQRDCVAVFFWLCAPRLFVAWRWKGWPNARASGARSCRYINTLLRARARKRGLPKPPRAHMETILRDDFTGEKLAWRARYSMDVVQHYTCVITAHDITMGSFALVKICAPQSVSHFY